jgi:hypothetical protein
MVWVHGSGGAIVGLTDGGNKYTLIEASTHMDEDIPIATPNIVNTPFAYRYGSNGRFRVTTPNTDIGYMEPGNSVVSYNVFDNGSWGLAASTSSTDYIIYFLLKTNFSQIPYVKLIGTEVYASRSAARAALLNDIRAINLKGGPGAEMEFQAAYICKRNGTLEDAGSPTYNTHVDLRGIPVN